MNVDRAALAQYLRQMAELGMDELYLETMTAREALDVLAGRAPAVTSSVRAPAATAPGRAPAATAPVREPVVGAPAAEPTVQNTPAPGSTPAPAVKPAVTMAPGSAPTVEPAVRTLDVLRDAVTACVACDLHSTRSTTVFGEGSPTADVVIVGEAPGQEEDRTGRPFVGRAGKLLDLLLMTVGLPRDDVFICNTLKCRPPQNRNPLPEEVAACSGFLRGQLDAISPRVLLAVGKFAAQALLGTEESITRLRGTIHTYQGTPLIVTYHPAYLLRSPQMTRLAWQDFQLLRRVLDEQA